MHGSPLTVFLLILPRLNNLLLVPFSNELSLSHLQFLFKAPFSVLQIQPVTSASSLTKIYLVKIIFPPSAKHLTTIFGKYDKCDPHLTSILPSSLTSILPSSLQTLWFLQNLITVIHCTAISAFLLYLLTAFKKCKISWPASLLWDPSVRHHHHITPLESFFKASSSSAYSFQNCLFNLQNTSKSSTFLPVRSPYSIHSF